MRPSKRDELVSKALEIFYLNGFHATGMDRIVEDAGISKTSIYNHFRTKDDLILATLRLRDERFRHWLFRRMEELSETPKGQIVALFDALGEWFATTEFRGCMFVKAAAEFQEPANPIFRQAFEHKRLIGDHLASLVRAAKLPEPDRLAKQIMLLKEGAIVAAQLQMFANPALEARDAASVLLGGVDVG